MADPSKEPANLLLESEPIGARVLNPDGAILGNTPLTLRLNPGSYRFTFSLDEPFVPVTEEVQVIGGSSARLLARLEKRPGKARIETKPPGAEVLQGDRRLGTTPCTITVEDGKVLHVMLVLEGYGRRKVEITGESNRTQEILCALAPQPAVLDVKSTPRGADILNEKGVRIGAAPMLLTLEPGRRTLTFRGGDDFENTVEEVELGPGERKTLTVDLVRRMAEVEITSVPRGALVLQEGRKLGATPCTVELRAGEETKVQLTLEGYKDHAMTIQATGGKKVWADARMELAEVEGLTLVETNSQGFQEFRNEKDGSTLIFVPDGAYNRGSNDGDADEGPQRLIEMPGFYIGKYPVTNAQWDLFAKETGRRNLPRPAGFEGPDQPMVLITWEDAREYCAWAGLMLPTEAQWEKAARGADGRRYPWGDRHPKHLLDRIAPLLGRTPRPPLANFASEGTVPVGSYPEGASPFGLMDVAGNVYEWTADWYDPDYYRDSPTESPPGPSDGRERVVRGGSFSSPLPSWQEVFASLKEGALGWDAFLLPVPQLRVTTRMAFDPTYRNTNLGFRVARPHP